MTSWPGHNLLRIRACQPAIGRACYVIPLDAIGWLVVVQVKHDATANQITKAGMANQSKSLDRMIG